MTAWTATLKKERSFFNPVIFEHKEEKENEESRSQLFLGKTGTVFAEKENVIPFPCLEFVSDDFKLYNEKEIRCFLDGHPEIIDCLNLSKEAIKKYFNSSSLELQLIIDFENEESQRKVIFINIETDIFPKEALSLLKKIDEELFENLKLDPELFNIDLKFKL